MHKDLLAQAAFLTEKDPRKPKQVSLRRAVSSAYYALFHYLVDAACRQLLGMQHDKRRFRDVLARGFEHGCMKDACKAFASGALPRNIESVLTSSFVIPPDLKIVARTFVQTQEIRHLADYDRSARFARSDVKMFVQDVQLAISTFESISDANLRQFFLACLLTWKTLKR